MSGLQAHSTGGGGGDLRLMGCLYSGHGAGYLQASLHWVFTARAVLSVLTPPALLELSLVGSRLQVNPITLSYPFPFVLPQALVPPNRVVSARGENTPL